MPTLWRARQVFALVCVLGCGPILPLSAGTSPVTCSAMDQVPGVPEPRKPESAARDFRACYRRLGEPRVLVVGMGGPAASEPHGSDAPPGPARVARTLADPVRQTLTEHGVRTLASPAGPSESGRGPADDPGAAARAAGLAADADLVVLCWVEQEGAALAASYLLVDIRRDRTLGSWAFDLAPGPAGVLDNRRLNQFGLELGKEVVARMMDAASQANQWVLVFERFDDAEIRLIRRQLTLVRGLTNLGATTLGRNAQGPWSRLEATYQRGCGELAAGIVDELRMAGIPAVATSARPGEVRFSADRAVLTGPERFLAGAEPDSPESAGARRALEQALARIGQPPIGIEFAGTPDTNLADAMTGRLRDLSVRVAPRELLAPGDLVIRVEQSAGAPPSFSLRFVQGDIVAGMASELDAARSAKATATIAVARLLHGLVDFAGSPLAVTIGVRDARSPEDVQALAHALRTLRGVSGVWVRRMSFGASGDQAELIVLSRSNGVGVVMRLQERVPELAFGIGEDLVTPGRVELTLKDR